MRFLFVFLVVVNCHWHISYSTATVYPLCNLSFSYFDSLYLHVGSFLFYVPLCLGMLLMLHEINSFPVTRLFAPLWKHTKYIHSMLPLVTCRLAYEFAVWIPQTIYCDRAHMFSKSKRQIVTRSQGVLFCGGFYPMLFDFFADLYITIRPCVCSSFFVPFSC